MLKNYENTLKTTNEEIKKKLNEIATLYGGLADLREKMLNVIQTLSSGEIPVKEEKTPVKEKKEEKEEKKQEFEVVVVDGEEFIKCPQCGTLNSKDAIMCYNCGYVFKPEEL